MSRIATALIIIALLLPLAAHADTGIYAVGKSSKEGI